MSTVSKPAAVAAGSGFVTGLVTLAYALADKAHLAPSSFDASVQSGTALVVTSVVAFMAHHFGMSKLSATKVEGEIEKDWPEVKEAYDLVRPIADNVPAVAKLAEEARTEAEKANAAADGIPAAVAAEVKLQFGELLAQLAAQSK